MKTQPLLAKITVVLLAGLFAACATPEITRVETVVEPVPVVYEVGATGPAGGFIVYDKGRVSDGWRYIEAAPVGWSGDAADPVAVWGGTGTLAGAQLDVAGSGLANTIAILDVFGEADPDTARADYAARLCADAVINGFDDWFLPSRDTMIAAYENLYRAGMGGLTTGSYWTSTERNTERAMAFNTATAGMISARKVHECHVRPVRRF